jgi:hypothetical protein
LQLHPPPAQRQIDRIDHPIAGQVEDHARSITPRARRLEPARGPSSMDVETHPSQRRATSPCVNDSPRSTARCPFSCHHRHWPECSVALGARCARTHNQTRESHLEVPVSRRRLASRQP